MEVFYIEWIAANEQLGRELDDAREKPAGDIVGLGIITDRVVAHYKSYYEQIHLVSNRNVKIVFNPTWLTHLEQDFHWLGGWYPTIFFNILKKSESSFCNMQRSAIQVLEAAKLEEERHIIMQCMSIREAMERPDFLISVARLGMVRNGNSIRFEQYFLDIVSLSLKFLLKRAEILRVSIFTDLKEILNPLQMVVFLSAIVDLQLTIRRMGLEVDADI
ncbi:hypothetical protein ZOSMA_114G00540 [Zostera marina]|uniref:DOG1 domain-containing protein n=1 Tax=Zostera marina TaxID=29655 RepID=A0A0K9Q4K5_ZOSMR|nr:hypothetical protein ZOSMA_114G00540 [Zostera marina]